MGEILYDFFFGNSPRREHYMYQTPHIIAIVATVLVAVALAVWARKMNKKQKQTILWVFFGVLLAFEIMFRINRLVRNHPWYDFIPMHFSSISVWMAIIAIGTRKKSLLNLATISCMMSSIAFLAHPAVGFNVTVLKFNNYYSIITHCIGFVFGTFTIAAGLVSYKINELWKTVLYIALVLGYSALLNFVFFPGENFLYYVDNITALPYWAFLAGYFAILIIYVAIYYLSYHFHSKRKLRKETQLELNESA